MLPPQEPRPTLGPSDIDLVSPPTFLYAHADVESCQELHVSAELLAVQDSDRTQLD